jgi:cobalt-zinc-cadmium resistance protein CzcA
MLMIKIGVSQTIKFPTVYKRQKQLLIEEAKRANGTKLYRKRIK